MAVVFIVSVRKGELSRFCKFGVFNVFFGFNTRFSFFELFFEFKSF